MFFSRKRFQNIIKKQKNYSLLCENHTAEWPEGGAISMANAYETLIVFSVKGGDEDVAAKVFVANLWPIHEHCL